MLEKAGLLLRIGGEAKTEEDRAIFLSSAIRITPETKEKLKLLGVGGRHFIGRSILFCILFQVLYYHK